MSKNTESIIQEIKPHTIKKLELIENYVESWCHKLLENKSCNTLVFIDCMSNSGEYISVEGKKVYGTAVRVSKIMYHVMEKYPEKKAILIFNDYNQEKIEHLKELLPPNRTNFQILCYTEDANKLLPTIKTQFSGKGLHTLLVYDPYQATICWKAIYPYLNTWSEVIINHMVYDTMRSVRIAKKEETREKYAATYLVENFEELLESNPTREEYEERIQEIVQVLHKNHNYKYYVASFPFFNQKNGLVYDLIHCTSNIEGFKLFKKTAWKVFDGHSSGKNINEELVFDFENAGLKKEVVDEKCFGLEDVATYLQKKYSGEKVQLNTIWECLDEHPIFPGDGFRNEIKKLLKVNYGAEPHRMDIEFRKK